MNKRFLTESEQRALLQAAKRCADPLAQRDYWWMRCMLATGARVNEFSLITVDQAERALASGYLVIRPEQRKKSPKGNKAPAHEYVVTATVRESLQALLALQREEATRWAIEGPQPLMWGRTGGPLSVRSLQARIKHWGQVAGLGDRISPHWLRHTRGVNIVRRTRSGNPIKTVQLALGHRNASTSAIYTQMAAADFERDMHAIDGACMSRAAARAYELGARS
jgi:site-specific recombinase XerC